MCVCTRERTDHHLIILHLLFLIVLALLLLLQSSIKGVNREVVNVSVLKQSSNISLSRFVCLWLMWAEPHRPLFESLQQLLLDGVVQLSSNQSFFLPTQTHVNTHAGDNTHKWMISVTHFLPLLSPFYLPAEGNQLPPTHTHTLIHHSSENSVYMDAVVYLLSLEDQFPHADQVLGDLGETLFAFVSNESRPVD